MGMLVPPETSPPPVTNIITWRFDSGVDPAGVQMEMVKQSSADSLANCPARGFSPESTIWLPVMLSAQMVGMAETYCGQAGPKVVESMIEEELSRGSGGVHLRGPTGGWMPNQDTVERGK